MKWARTRILAGFLAALVLVLAGAVYTLSLIHISEPTRPY